VEEASAEKERGGRNVDRDSKIAETTGEAEIQHKGGIGGLRMEQPAVAESARRSGCASPIYERFALSGV